MSTSAERASPYVLHDFGDRPFLRWAGGKQQIRRLIMPRLVGLSEGGCYFEPFLGAGTMFLALRPAASILSDLNGHLMATYVAIRRDPMRVADAVERLAARHSSDHYYAIRTEYNRRRPSAQRAAQFIYLNRAGYNGVFRVNLRGEFNVPVGNKERLAIPSSDYLCRLALLLQTAQLMTSSYERALSAARDGDLVYLDPPYPPLNGTSFFRHYTKERFHDADQTAVAALADRLRRRGCRVVITNADTPLIRELYRNWRLEELSVPRWVMSGTRHRVQELLIMSC